MKRKYVREYDDFEDPTKNLINDRLSSLAFELSGAIWLLDGTRLGTCKSFIDRGIDPTTIHVAECNFDNYTLMMPTAKKIKCNLKFGLIEDLIPTAAKSEKISIIYADFMGNSLGSFHSIMRKISTPSLGHPLVIAVTLSTRFRDNDSLYSEKFPRPYGKNRKWTIVSVQQRIADFLQHEYFTDSKVQLQTFFVYKRCNDDLRQGQTMMHLVYLLNWHENVDVEFLPRTQKRGVLGGRTARILVS